MELKDSRFGKTLILEKEERQALSKFLQKIYCPGFQGGNARSLTRAGLSIGGAMQTITRKNLPAFISSLDKIKAEYPNAIGQWFEEAVNHYKKNITIRRNHLQKETKIFLKVPVHLLTQMIQIGTVNLQVAKGKTKEREENLFLKAAFRNQKPS
jgi:hypothetical protein